MITEIYLFTQMSLFLKHQSPFWYSIIRNKVYNTKRFRTLTIIFIFQNVDERSIFFQSGRKRHGTRRYITTHKCNGMWNWVL